MSTSSRPQSAPFAASASRTSSAAASKSPLPLSLRAGGIPQDKVLLSGLSEGAQRAYVEKQQRRQLQQLVGQPVSRLSRPHSAAAYARAQLDSSYPNYGAHESPSLLPPHTYGHGLDVTSSDGSHYTTAGTPLPIGHQPRSPWGGQVEVVTAPIAYKNEGINHANGALLQLQREELAWVDRIAGEEQRQRAAAVAAGIQPDDSHSRGPPVGTSAILAQAATRTPMPTSIYDSIRINPNTSTHRSSIQSGVASLSASPLSVNRPRTAPSPSKTNRSGLLVPFNNSVTSAQSPLNATTSASPSDATNFYNYYADSPLLQRMRAESGIIAASRPSTAMNFSTTSGRGLGGAGSPKGDNNGLQSLSALAIAPYPARNLRPVNADFLIKALEANPTNAVAWDGLGAMMADGRFRTHLRAPWEADRLAKASAVVDSNLASSPTLLLCEGGQTAVDPSLNAAAASPLKAVRAWRVAQSGQLIKNKDLQEDQQGREKEHLAILQTSPQASIHSKHWEGYYANQSLQPQDNIPGRVPIPLGKDITAGAVSGGHASQNVGSIGSPNNSYAVVVANQVTDGSLCACDEWAGEDGGHLGESSYYCYISGVKYGPLGCFAKAIEIDHMLGSAWGHLAMWLIQKQREPGLITMLGAGGGIASPMMEQPADGIEDGGSQQPPYSHPFGQLAAQMELDEEDADSQYYYPSYERQKQKQKTDDRGEVATAGSKVPNPANRQHDSNGSYVAMLGKQFTMRDCLAKALEGYDATNTNAAAWNYLGVNLGENNRKNGAGDDVGGDEDCEGYAQIDDDGFGEGWPSDAPASPFQRQATNPGTMSNIVSQQRQPTSVSVGGREFNAKKCFQRALECDITFPEAWVNLATVLNPNNSNPGEYVLVKGKMYTQRQCLMKVLSMYPSYSHAWNTLGFLLEPLVEVVAIVPDADGCLKIEQRTSAFGSYSETSGPYGLGSPSRSQSIAKRGIDDDMNGDEERDCKPHMTGTFAPRSQRKPLLASKYSPAIHGTAASGVSPAVLGSDN